MYIDSEIDISGNLLVKEIIEINNLDEDFNYKMYFKDMNLTLNDKNYYDGFNISIEKIGYLDEKYNFEKISTSDFAKYIIETNDNDLLVLEVNSGVSIDKCTNFIKDGYNIAKSIYKEAVIEMFKDNPNVVITSVDELRGLKDE